MIPIGAGAILVALREGGPGRRKVACDVGTVLCIVGFTLPIFGKNICIPVHECCRSVE